MIYVATFVDMITITTINIDQSVKIFINGIQYNSTIASNQYYMIDSDINQLQNMINVECDYSVADKSTFYIKASDQTYTIHNGNRFNCATVVDGDGAVVIEYTNQQPSIDSAQLFTIETDGIYYRNQELPTTDTFLIPQGDDGIVLSQTKYTHPLWIYDKEDGSDPLVYFDQEIAITE